MAQAEYAVDRAAVQITGSIGLITKGGKLYEKHGKRYSGLALSPSINCLLTRNFFFGGSIQYSSHTSDENNRSTISIGPHLGIISGNAGSNLFPYLSSGLSYHRDNISQLRGNDNTNIIHGTDITFTAGAAYAIVKHCGLNISMQYYIVKLRENGNDLPSGDVVSFNIGITALLFKGAEKNTGTQ